MEKQDGQLAELASAEKLEKAIGLLEELEDIDTGDLQRRFEATIAARRKRSRRLRIVRGCAAVLAPLLVLGGILWTIGRQSADTTISKVNENVVLTLPDGSQIAMEEIDVDALVVELDDAVVKREAGSLVYQPVDEAARHEVLYSRLDVPRGNRFDIVLPDGTRVWLNSDSRMRFPSAFAGSERRVYVEGEAYFEVARDAEKPFVVEAPGQVLTVLGTQFNIYAYPGEGSVYTTLVEGSVEVRSDKSERGKILSPGQQSQLDIAADEFTLKTVNAREMAAWKNGVFVFDGCNLEQVFTKISRWYDIDYRFEDQQAANLIFRGNIRITNDIETILDSMEALGKVEIKVKGKEVIIKTKQ